MKTLAVYSVFFFFELQDAIELFNYKIVEKNFHFLRLSQKKDNSNCPLT